MRLPLQLISPLFLLLFAATAARADDAVPSLVAGYKALFTCSATFLAERTPEQIARNEFEGIYADYRAPMAALPEAVIDRAARTVSVAFDTLMPPRVAKFRALVGCTLLPPGADPRMNIPGLDFLDTGADQATGAWPDGDVIDTTPATADAAGPPLAAILARSFDSTSYGPGTRTSGVVVVRDGRIVGEAYSPDSGVHVPQRTWSVGKTLMGALIGIAAMDGALRLDDRGLFPEWQSVGDPRGQITVAHLMHMASGLDSGAAGNRTDEVYFGGGLIVDHVPTRELVAAPGARWFYANNDTLALSYLLRIRLADERAYLSYPYERLFRRIGMRHTYAETDWGGIYVMSSQVWTTARDLARFGLLLLNDGRWNNERVLREGWVKMMATPSPVQPAETRADGSAVAGYGAQIWLFGSRHGLPEGTMAAIGNRGQYVVIVPSAQLVVVRRGFDPEGARFSIERLTADIIAALE